MASFGQALAPLALAGVSALLLGLGCSGNTTGDGQTGAGATQGGAAHTAGASSQSGKGGSSSAGTTSHSGGAAGSTSSSCDPGCMQLCEGGLCSCFCEPTCQDFTQPGFDKSCVADDDCFAGVHTADCCGSKVVLGYNVSQQARFDGYEVDCTAQALCRCAPDEPRLEGGQATSDLEQRSATCVSGQCLGTGPVNVGGM